MAALKWIGTGVLRIGKETLEHGDTIPVKKLSKEKLARLKKEKSIGANIEPVPEETPSE